MFNQQTLIGRLGADPEMRETPSGVTIAVMSVATTEKWKDQAGELQERTDWHRIEAFGRNAEFARQYLKKGALVFVQGATHHDVSDKGGVKRYFTKVKCDTLRALGAKGADAKEEGDAKPAVNKPGTPESRRSKLDDFDDDIPF